MHVSIEDTQSDLKLNHLEVKSLVEHSISHEGFICDEVALHFVTKEKISSLHDKYFKDPSPTDCISFPIDGKGAVGYSHLGEVFVCPKVAIEYALQHGQDSYTELSLYIVHGLLHLMGYDDLEEKERERMREAEKRHLKWLSQEKKILKKP